MIPMVPIITIRDAPSRRPPTSIPAAIQAALAGLLNSAVPIDQRHGTPTHRTWGRVKGRVQHECERYFAAFERDSRIELGERTFDGTAWVTAALRDPLDGLLVQVIPRNALELRVYLLAWRGMPDCELTLTAVSHFAELETFRSLYAP
jgi:hypothetical protein